MRRAINGLVTKLPLLLVGSAVTLTACTSAMNWENQSSSSTGGEVVYVTEADSADASYSQYSGSALSSVNNGYHRVVDGDTLYSIAWRYQLDYRDLARWNGRENSSLIYSGERLRLTAPKGAAVAKKPRVSVAKRPTVKKPPASTTTSPAGTTSPVQGGVVVTGEPSISAMRTLESMRWQWPANGVVSSISHGPQSRLKGMLISAKNGEPIVAAESGEVVYIGTELARYGELLIIKHSETIFSAYAHLKKIQVKQDQQVGRGQQLATMGEVAETGKSAFRFSMRDGSQTLDPLDLLPQK